MSWSHEDSQITKPSLADAVLASLKQARAALEAKEGVSRSSSVSTSQVTSKDWMPMYESQSLDVDVAFAQVFEGDPLMLSPTDAASNNYLAEFNNAFSGVPITPSPAVAADKFAAETPTLTKDAPVRKAPARKRKRRKISREPEVKEYVDNPTDVDVLLGRGGKSNHHLGNKRYRDEVGNMQSWYKSSLKEDKTDLSQNVVDYVHSYGGRFLKKDPKVDRWYVVPNIVARKKASQALREHKTPEERAQLKLLASKAEPS